jgi:flagellar assembly protein FliH
MAKIFKANQIKLDPEKAIFIETKQDIPKPAAPQADPEEVAFVNEVFQALSPEHLAGAGQTLKTNKTEDGEVNPEGEMLEQTAGAPAAPAAPAPAAPPAQPQASVLSKASHKSRHRAALDALKIKELELEALEEELREWEASLREKETQLTTKEQTIHNETMTKRNEVEAESKKIIDMAKSSAASITQTANAEAEAVRKAAEIEVEDVRNKAYKEGYALGEEKGISAGEEQGLHEARLDWQNLMKESEMLINELQTSRMGILKAAEEEMVRLIISFAKSVIKVEPLAQPEIILRNVDAAINKISDVDKIVMRINLKDKSMCQAHKDQFLQKLSSVAELQIIEDQTLTPGGIKIETGVGTIDATIESQAQELERALMEKFKKAQG